MGSFLIRRVVFLVSALLVASAISFSIPYLRSGDPARIILQSRTGDLAVDPKTVAALSRQLGLDKPVYVQYVDWLRQTVQGNFGYSFVGGQSVVDVVLKALGVSVVLALATMALAGLFGLPLGILAALKPGRPLDSAITSFTQALVPTPEYLTGPVGILVFAVWLGWLPVAGWFGPKYVVLPAAVLALRPLAYLANLTRAEMIDILGAPYVTAARARGLSRGRTVAFHAVRNGLAPGMTLFSMWFASLIGGSVVVEVIFGIPGMGNLLYQAVVNSDVPVIQGALLFIVGLIVVITTLTDIAYGLVNPAVAVGGRAAR